jgi:fatty acid desaturase
LNTGTKIRTALRVAVSLNTAVYTVTAAVGQLGWGWLTVAWAVLTIISDFAVAFLTTFFNNDYTEVAAKHTAEMRQEKAELKKGYIGDKFFTGEGDHER